MNKHHHINYIEFQANDLKTIKRFYSTTFGWQFTDYGSDYEAFNDGSLDGGFALGETKGGSMALVILYSDNLETSLDDVKKNGGKITKPIFSFPGGRRFHFAFADSSWGAEAKENDLKVGGKFTTTMFAKDKSACEIKRTV